MSSQPQTYVRLPEHLKEQLKVIAKNEGWTMNQAMIEAVKLLVKQKS